jgi:hypothetical protein
MPITDFAALPDEARVWVFAADVPLAPEAAAALLAAVDEYLAQWHAHGAPLTCARELREDRFLAVGVDQRTAGASGCSVDGLFRVFQRVGPTLGASLLPSGRVYWRAADGTVVAGERAAFTAASRAGAVSAATPVFDPTVLDVGSWRARFEIAAGEAWHRTLL